ncbi:MAG: glycosyltransferase family 2 protein [Candidatus Helarchaeota archaeon]
MFKIKIIVLIPAYNTEKKIFKVFESLEKVRNYFHEIIIIDDGSQDATLKNILKIKKNWKYKQKIFIYRHKQNVGYGGTQKNLFKHFLERDGDIAVLIHSDNQYPPERIKSLIKPIVNGTADIVLASRFYKNLNYHQQMPSYKIIGNRFLTFLENLVLRSNLTEFHTGLRAYSRNFIEKIDFYKFSNDFDFDSEILFEAINKKFRIEEIAVFAYYEDSFSNVNSIIYGYKIFILILKHLFKKIFLKKY